MPSSPSDPQGSGHPARSPLFPWWLWPLGVLLGLMLAILGWALFLALPLPSSSTQVVPPQFTVYPPPSLTPGPTPVPPEATPSAVPPTPAPGVLGVGGTVQVVGTGSDGLRLRDKPSLKGAILLLVGDNEVFSVQQGPVQADGFTWWYLQGLYDFTRKGWAVQNYLQAVNP
ncbi:MAG: hypothetical protein ABSB61_12650 [Anaerolineales bacterium]